MGRSACLEASSDFNQLISSHTNKYLILGKEKKKGQQRLLLLLYNNFYPSLQGNDIWMLNIQREREWMHLLKLIVRIGFRLISDRLGCCSLMTNNPPIFSLRVCKRRVEEKCFGYTFLMLSTKALRWNLHRQELVYLLLLSHSAVDYWLDEMSGSR